MFRNEAENDYPNRFPSVAQVGPVSSGPTIASVRNEEAYADVKYITAYSVVFSK
ncbi:MAG: hypothetical protein IJL20_06900 [Lachnospiraceae bacterium]|nr:hypothetical protein [Lachnospiraceae bacterium]